MTAREKRANEIENLYVKAKANEIGAMEKLYNELRPMFSAFYTIKTNRILYNFRDFEEDACQIFYLYLNDAVNNYLPERKSTFISFIHYYFQKTISDLFVVNNEFQKKYKPFIKEDVEQGKLCSIIDNQLNNNTSDLNDFEQTLVCILKEPELSLILARFGFIEIPCEKDSPTADEIAEYLFKSNITKQKYSYETLRHIYKSALTKLKKHKYELL